MTDSIDLTMVERPVDTALTAVEASVDKAVDSLDETGMVPGCAKDKVLALVAAGKAGLEGTRKLNHEVVSTTAASLNSQMATGRAVMAATSLEDAVALQRDYLETTYRDALAQNAKLATIALATANDAVQPLSKEASATINGWRRSTA